MMMMMKEEEDKEEEMIVGWCDFKDLPCEVFSSSPGRISFSLSGLQIELVIDFY